MTRGLHSCLGVGRAACFTHILISLHLRRKKSSLFWDQEEDSGCARSHDSLAPWLGMQGGDTVDWPDFNPMPAPEAKREDLRRLSAWQVLYGTLWRQAISQRTWQESAGTNTKEERLLCGRNNECSPWGPKKSTWKTDCLTPTILDSTQHLMSLWVQMVLPALFMVQSCNSSVPF